MTGVRFAIRHGGHGKPRLRYQDSSLSFPNNSHTDETALLDISALWQRFGCVLLLRGGQATCSSAEDVRGTAAKPKIERTTTNNPESL